MLSFPDHSLWLNVQLNLERVTHVRYTKRSPIDGKAGAGVYEPETASRSGLENYPPVFKLRYSLS